MHSQRNSAPGWTLLPPMYRDTHSLVPRFFEPTIAIASLGEYSFVPEGLVAPWRRNSRDSAGAYEAGRKAHRGAWSLEYHVALPLATHGATILNQLGAVTASVTGHDQPALEFRQLGLVPPALDLLTSWTPTRLRAIFFTVHKCRRSHNARRGSASSIFLPSSRHALIKKGTNIKQAWTRKIRAMNRAT